jgi:hypothetical protein
MFKPVLGTALVLAALAASAGQYGSAPSPRGEKLRVTCAGSEVVRADCSLAGIGKDGRQAYPATALRFTDLTSQTKLLRQVALAKRENPAVGDIPMDAQSVAVLDAIDWERCFESKQMGGLAVLCAPPGPEPDWAVLFLRGLCDRCRFEPIVLKKE